MTNPTDYTLWNYEYPPRKKRTDNVIGWLERDEDGGCGIFARKEKMMVEPKGQVGHCAYYASRRKEDKACGQPQTRKVA
jgi:hypothetical protein